MLSDKQKDLIRFAKQEGTISFSVGAIRSGKTFAGSAAFVAYTQAQENAYVHLILGRKLRVIETEILPEVKSFADAWEIPYNYNRGDQKIEIGSQTYLLRAGNDVRSGDSLQGVTVHSALIDEATLLPEEFFKSAISRLTYGDSKAWVLCNPSFPQHWLKKKWLDAALVQQHLQFTFEDNPTLSEEVKARNRAMFAGVFASRMVQGLWAAAEGLIYPDFHLETYDKEWKVEQTSVGCDYGIASTFALVALQRLRHKKEKTIQYHVPWCAGIKGGNDIKNPDDSELADFTMGRFTQDPFRSIIIDPSAASFRAQLLKTKNRKFNLRKAKNDVGPGIRTTGALLTTKELTVDPDCTPLIEELESYAWDETKEDTPLKQNDHYCDALRYAVMDMCNNLATTGISIPRGM